MSKRIQRLFILALFVTAFMSYGFAQGTGKIGVVNSQEVLEKSIGGKKAIAQLEERGKKAQADLTRLENEIKALETKLSVQRLTLSEEETLRINSDLEKKKTAQKRFNEDATRELQEFQYRLFTQVQNELMPIIASVGKEKGMDMIYDLGKGGVVYFNPAIDLTQDVILKYDASQGTPSK